MTARINRHLLEQTRHDSGELVQPDFVVLHCANAGRQQVDVYRHGKLAGSVLLDVEAECPDKQVTIDLAMLERPPKNDHCCCEEKPHGHRVEKGGYALFHVGSGSGGYSLKSYPLDTRKDSRPFDSQHLQQGDLFGTTLLRPGKYRLEDRAAKISLPLWVEPVKPGSTRYVPPEALHLDMDELRKRKDIRLQQAQGLVIRTEKDNRILIELDEKNAGDGKTSRKVARMTRAARRR